MPPTPDTHTKKEPLGPLIGIGVIVVVMLFGAVYYFEARAKNPLDSVPYIPADNSTTTSS